MSSRRPDHPKQGRSAGPPGSRSDSDRSGPGRAGGGQAAPERRELRSRRTDDPDAPLPPIDKSRYRRKSDKSLLRWGKRYLIGVGILAHIAAPIGGYLLVRQLNLDVGRYIDKGLDAAQSGQLSNKVFGPNAVDPTGMALDGQFREAHPRLMLPQIADWNGEGMAPLIKTRVDALRERRWWRSACKNHSLPNRVVCWLTEGDANAGRDAINLLRRFDFFKKPNAGGNYGNGDQIALFYDFLSKHPEMTDNDRQVISEKLAGALESYLKVLEGDGASLWHGRTTLAGNAWMLAVALDPQNQRHRDLRRRAQAHFLDAMQALALVEGWPEGYTYWINIRGYRLVQAMGSYLNGMEGSEHNEAIKALLWKVGRWHVQGVRPDLRFEGYGDEGSRVDLKEETLRVTELIAELIDDPLMTSYSRFLQDKFRNWAIYKGYRRWRFLSFDPDRTGVAGVLPGEMVGLESALPQMEVFGGHGYGGSAYLHSGWDSDATFISFRATHPFVHHGHYDAGHFSLFKGKPLAINSSTYRKINDPHRLNYSIRSVAKNSLLVRRPGDDVRPNRTFTESVNDGGQRLPIPNGSWVRNVEHFKDNLNSGMHLRGAKLNGYQYGENVFGYISADLTAAYDTPVYDSQGAGGRVKQADRDLLYLFADDVLFVHDRVLSVDPSYKKKWLLHTVNKPVGGTPELLIGDLKDGIMDVTDTNSFSVNNEDAWLDVKILQPAQPVTRLVGGPSYQFYVEKDGDESQFDGTNMSAGAVNQPWFDIGYWRMEVMPPAANEEDHFLVALSPSLGARRADAVVPVPTLSGTAHAGATERNLVVFADKPSKQAVRLRMPGSQTRLYLGGVRPGSSVTVREGGLEKQREVSEAGLLTLRLSGIPGSIVELSW